MSEIEHKGMPDQERLRAARKAEAHGRLAGLRQQLYGSASRHMCEAASLKPGDTILDIAAGTGDQSRLAARMVEPGGSVLATDISQEMLDVAARLAQQEGLSNLTIRAMNAEQLDLPDNQYDAAISRFGLMFIPHKQRVLAEILRVLKPEGRLSSLVWSKPERNPLFILSDLIVAKALAREGRAEVASTPAFSLADAAPFASMLIDAGFREVRVQIMELTFRFPSHEMLTRWWGSNFEEALAKFEPESRQRVHEEIRQAVRQYEGPQGIVAPAELLLATGRK